MLEGQSWSRDALLETKLVALCKLRASWIKKKTTTFPKNKHFRAEEELWVVGLFFIGNNSFIQQLCSRTIVLLLDISYLDAVWGIYSIPETLMKSLIVKLLYFLPTDCESKTNYNINYMYCILMERRLMELQVVFIKNAEKEVRLGILTLENSRAQTIVIGIKDILDYFELRASIKMIVTGTTAVNIGRKNGIMVILQLQQKLLNLPVAQYVGCQYHVLDCILKTSHG